MSSTQTPRKPYPSDMTEADWSQIEPMLRRTKIKRVGRPQTVDLREVVNAIRYVLRSGCQWDMLPHDFPPKSTVYEYFSLWTKNGTWEKMCAALGAEIRIQEGHDPQPSIACIDSQTVKTTEVGGEERGYDGGKKIKGRKRHLLVDKLGLLLVVLVTGAQVDDGVAAPEVLRKISEAKLPRLETIFGDNKYRNHDLNEWLNENHPGWKVVVGEKPEGVKGFVPLRKRWVIERTFAWLGRWRRLSKDYERTTRSSEGMILCSQAMRMARYLAPVKAAPFKYEQSI